MVENMIDVALQEAIEKYRDNKLLCDAFKRSKAVWDNISITCLEFLGMTYDEFLEYLESHSNILFLPDDKMKDYNKALQIIDVMKD